MEWEQPAEQWLFVQAPISREDGSNLGLMGMMTGEDMQGVSSGESGIRTGSSGWERLGELLWVGGDGPWITGLVFSVARLPMKTRQFGGAG